PSQATMLKPAMPSRTRRTSPLVLPALTASLSAMAKAPARLLDLSLDDQLRPWYQPMSLAVSCIATTYQTPPWQITSYPPRDPHNCRVGVPFNTAPYSPSCSRLAEPNPNRLAMPANSPAIHGFACMNGSTASIAAASSRLCANTVNAANARA